MPNANIFQFIGIVLWKSILHEFIKIWTKQISNSIKFYTLTSYVIVGFFIQSLHLLMHHELLVSPY